jgi:hypothetical protein
MGVPISGKLNPNPKHGNGAFGSASPTTRCPPNSSSFSDPLFPPLGCNLLECVDYVSFANWCYVIIIWPRKGERKDEMHEQMKEGDLKAGPHQMDSTHISTLSVT